MTILVKAKIQKTAKCEEEAKSWQGQRKMNTISISKRLGHAQPSTTANIYAHVIEDADQQNADILADIFLKKA